VLRMLILGVLLLVLAADIGCAANSIEAPSAKYAMIGLFIQQQLLGLEVVKSKYETYVGY